jgi:hypothetical protein
MFYNCVLREVHLDGISPEAFESAAREVGIFIL